MGMTRAEAQALYDEFMATDGPDIDLAVVRSTEAQLRDGLGTTLSVDATERLHAQMIAWVGTRVMRYHQQHGLMPQSVKVTLQVEVEA